MEICTDVDSQPRGPHPLAGGVEIKLPVTKIELSFYENQIFAV